MTDDEKRRMDEAWWDLAFVIQDVDDDLDAAERRYAEEVDAEERKYAEELARKDVDPGLPHGK